MLKARINLLAYAGTAKPNAKMGQSLGSLGINLMQFCKDFNSKTSHFYPDTPIRVRLHAFSDRSFKYTLKGPPTSWLIKRVAGIEKGSHHRAISLGRIGIKYVYEIARVKKELDYELKDVPLESVCRSVIAQCQAMNVLVDLVQDSPQPMKPFVKV